MKRLLLPILRLVNLPYWLRRRNRHAITILMLHGVARPAGANDSWQPLWERPTPERLDEILGQFVEHYQFISIADATRIVRGEREPVSNGMVVTFDDGYRNNLTEALPVLKKYAVPAVFYVATAYSENGQVYWIDRLDYALQNAPEDKRLINAVGQEFDLRNLRDQDLRDGYQRVRLAVKGKIHDDKRMLAILDRIGSELEQAAGTTVVDILDDDRFASVANWQELAAARAEGFEIGSHTVDHFQLTAISTDEVDLQLRESKVVVEDRLGPPCDHFCYPNGSQDETVAEQVRSAGYRSAVTTTRGVNRVGDDPMRLKRYPMPNKKTAFENLLAVSGFFELPMVRRLLG